MRLSPGMPGAPGQGGPLRPLGPSVPPHSELNPRYGAPFGRLCVPLGLHPVPQMPLTGEDWPQNVHVIAVRPCVGAVACLTAGVIPLQAARKMVPYQAGRWCVARLPKGGGR